MRRGNFFLFFFTTENCKFPGSTVYQSTAGDRVELVSVQSDTVFLFPLATAGSWVALRIGRLLIRICQLANHMTFP